MSGDDLPRLTACSLPGLLRVDLAVHDDSRGWFKENYQKAKLHSAGFPPLNFVQNNISYNTSAGTTRGVHAEPWDKYVSLASGRAFAAIVDLRRGETFGQVETIELNPSVALLVPRGCGNSFQTLADGTVYTYLVTAHWSQEARYVNVNLFDPELAIPWPIAQGASVVSDKDRAHPVLRDVVPMEV